MQAGKFSNVIVMAGAGISVSANLPDFRSKGGLYDQRLSCKGVVVDSEQLPLTAVKSSSCL